MRLRTRGESPGRNVGGRNRLRTRTERQGQDLGCGLGQRQGASIISGTRLSTQGQASQSPGHRDEIWDKAQQAGMGSGGRDQTQDGAWEPGEGPDWSSASRTAGSGAGTLTWNVPAAFQQLLHQREQRERDLECQTNTPLMPSEQSLSSRRFPAPTMTWGGLICGFCFSSVGMQGFVQT